METIKLCDIKPAAYNPRKLSEDAFDNLVASIKQLGIIKPIIVRKENNTIVAGHQRTKAMQAIGMTECPAFVLSGLGQSDEVRFNQIHNRCEYEVNPKAPVMKITAPLNLGFNRVSIDNVQIVKRGDLAVLNSNICCMVSKYGEFGCPVCTMQGDIIISAAYAFAHKVLGKDLWVCAISDDKVPIALDYFSKSYGTFSYEHLEKHTFIQCLAQMKRLRDGAKGKGNSFRSRMYEQVVIPWLLKQPNGKDLRILDFGAGEMDYVKRLQKAGYNIIGYDPYHRVAGCMKIDFAGNRKTLLFICEDIKTRGLYDVVVCDSVLNSVDSKQAEQSVIYSVAALCRLGGMVFISGRPMSDAQCHERMKKSTTKGESLIHFFDENGFSALYRNGEWFYQKFHTEKEMRDIKHIFGAEGNIYDNKTGFIIAVCKDRVTDVETSVRALRFEWDMVLPNNTRYGLADEIEKAYRYVSDNQ